jgi:hypothetical protein
MVCLSYLFERRPRLDLKDPTIAVVIAHKRKIKKAMQLGRVLSVDQNGALPDPCRIKICCGEIAQHHEMTQAFIL